MQAGLVSVKLLFVLISGPVRLLIGVGVGGIEVHLVDAEAVLPVVQHQVQLLLLLSLRRSFLGGTAAVGRGLAL